MSKDPQHWAQLGDFIGGLAGSAISFFALLGILYAVAMQREELRETKQAISDQSVHMELQARYVAQQAIDNRFFELANMYNTYVRSLRYDTADGPTQGNEAIRALLRDYLTRCSESVDHELFSTDQTDAMKALVGGVRLITEKFSHTYMGTGTIEFLVQQTILIEELSATFQSNSDELMHESLSVRETEYHGMFARFLSNEMKIWIYIFFMFTKRQGITPTSFGCLGTFLQFFQQDAQELTDLAPYLGQVARAIRICVDGPAVYFSKSEV
ncbi:MAG: hypothetical protein AAGL69_13495 [Pseudomonadota bacterium]